MSNPPKAMEECCVDEVGNLIQSMVRTLQIFERGKLSQQGFTMSQYYTLFNIQQNQTLTMNQLSEKMNLDTSTMSRVVATLERDGYILRERWEEDRRVIKVKLTDKGFITTQELSAEVRGYYQHIIGAIPQGQVDDVVKSVNTLLQAFEQVKPFCC